MTEKNKTNCKRTNNSSKDDHYDVIGSLLHDRLVLFYEKYNPSKVPDAKTVLAKYQGKENALFTALVKKYGPEPDAADSGNSDDNNSEADEKDDDAEEDAAVASETEGCEKNKEAGVDDNSETKTNLATCNTIAPNVVLYCPIDTLPPEYCEYGPCFDECKPFLLSHCPNLYLTKYSRTVAEYVGVENQIAAGVEGLSLQVDDKVDKKKNKRKIGIKDTTKAAEGVMQPNAKVSIERLQRSKKKCITLIFGLEGFPECSKLKDVAKVFGKKFACSASVNKVAESVGTGTGGSGALQIQLQGDCAQEVADLLVKNFKVPQDKIFFLKKGITERVFK